MQDSNPACQGFNSALDCLCLSDFIVQLILLAICLAYIIIVLFRLKSMGKPANYTPEQQRQLSQCNFIHYIILVYLITFLSCTVIACLIYLVLQNRWFVSEDDKKLIIDNAIVQSLIRGFWMLLYGYITILNIIFFIIAYNFLVKSKALRHEERSNVPFWSCFIVVVLQILSYCGYIFLILQYKDDQNNQNDESIQSHYLQALRFINLSWSVICTVVLIYIFCVSYRKKVSASAYVSQQIKKIENMNILGLTGLHFIRIGVETFNIISGGVICNWRELDPVTYLDKKHAYSIYLSIANLSMNIVPVFFILKVFKPPKKEFLRPSLMVSSAVSESYQF